MTASSAPDPAALLDELVALRGAATAGEWRLSHSRDDFGALVWVDDGNVTDEIDAADAALIVAAVNALPGLVGAVRAVLGLHVPTEGPYGTVCDHCISADENQADWPCVTYAAVTAALAGEPQP